MSSDIIYNKILPISLAPDAVPDWYSEEACRELIQNTLDLGGNVHVVDGDLRLETFEGMIPHKHLLIGSGSKANDKDSRGGKSEGMKLALLILVREGVTLEFINGVEKWVPYLQYSELFKEEQLYVGVMDYPEGEEGSVKITIKGLDNKTLDCIIKNTLTLQDQGYSKHDTSYGEILLGSRHKGKVFCGGLFVQEIKGFQEGFNFNPSQLQLDRDRRMVDRFDIQWITKEMWSEVTEVAEDDVADYIVQGLTNKSGSMRYLDSARPNVSETIKNKVLEVYKDKYDGKILATSYEHKEELQMSGNDNADYIDNAPFLQILEQTEEYKEIKLGIKVEKPINYLDEWKEKHYDSLTDQALYDYEDMCIKLQKFLK